MNLAVRIPGMTRDQFFDWAEAQDTRYEFDGFAPVAMTGGSVRHNQIAKNIARAVDIRIAVGCRTLGPDAGLRTTGEAVRYPDVLVTCSKVDDLAREVPGVLIVFEVLSPGSGHVDRIVKLREYRAVPSIRRYIIVEYASRALTLHARAEGETAWTTTALTAEDGLALPEIGVELPVAALFEGTDLAQAEAASNAG